MTPAIKNFTIIGAVLLIALFFQSFQTHFHIGLWMAALLLCAFILIARNHKEG